MQELHQVINRSLGKIEPPLRLAILGIGQELRGDDAAGLLLVRELKQKLPENENLLLIETGPTPENFTGILRRFRPELVLLVDVAWMDEQPGAVRWLTPNEITGVSALTHTLPLHVIASYLSSELGCETMLLAIQPRGVDFDQPVSEEVEEAVCSLVDGLPDQCL